MYEKMLSKVVLILALAKTTISVDPIIELPTGKILGLETKTFANTSYYTFQKIPYAAPPTEPLRFKAPQPAQKWNGTLNATKIDVRCLQNPSDPTTDSEDCLFLNVHTPRLPGNGETDLLPVMFYVHGGGFGTGWSNFHPPDLFIDQNVILVTVNYRLGFFGFVSTQDDIIPGNNGLKDQQFALKWTHNNIHLFGGSPDKITIFGESAGSASVAYQLLYQPNQDLLVGAILESGSFLSSWSLQREPRGIAFSTAAVLNSSYATSDDSQALLVFLQSVDAKELNEAATQYTQSIATPWDVNNAKSLTYGPVIEQKNPDAFLTKKMYGLLKAGNVVKVPTIIGINSEENLFWSRDPAVIQAGLTAFDNDSSLVVPVDMQISDPEKLLEVGTAIRDIYTQGKPWGTLIGAGVRLATDTCFSRPVTKTAELLSSVTETYFYQFSYDGDLGGFDVHYDGADNVAHAEELRYLFCLGNGCDFSGFPEGDQITSQRLIKIWTDFAKYQVPIPEPSDLLQNITWPKLSVDGGDFLYLDINEDLEIRNHPKAEPVQKWNELYDSLGFDDFDTY